MSFVRRSDQLARKMVGWTPCEIVGPSISRKVELATTPGDRPTHPTIPNQPRADCREREQIPAEKNLPELDDFLAGFYSYAECLLSVCAVRLDLGFSSGPSFRPERARLSEERIFDLSRSLCEVRRFLRAGARGEPESRLWRVFANGARRNVLAPNRWKAGVRFPSHRRSCPVKMPRLAVRRFSPPSSAAPPGLERKPGFRLSARAFKCDAAGFQRTSRMRGISARLGKRALRPE